MSSAWHVPHEQLGPFGPKGGMPFTTLSTCIPPYERRPKAIFLSDSGWWTAYDFMFSRKSAGVNFLPTGIRTGKENLNEQRHSIRHSGIDHSESFVDISIHPPVVGDFGSTPIN